MRTKESRAEAGVAIVRLATRFGELRARAIEMDAFGQGGATWAEACFAGIDCVNAMFGELERLARELEATEAH